MAEPTQAALVACPVGYCRAERGHRGLHDIPSCTKDCGPLRPGLGREHARHCLNHEENRHG